MACLTHIVIPGIPHHVTKRGNGRQQTFFTDDDYTFYRNLLRQYCAEHGVAILANYRASLVNFQNWPSPVALNRPQNGGTRVASPRILIARHPLRRPLQPPKKTSFLQHPLYAPIKPMTQQSFNAANPDLAVPTWV